MENKKDIGRYSSKNKMNIVLALIRSESLDELSRKHKIPASTISEWHQQFLDAGQSGLKSRQPDPRDEQIRKLKEKLGDLMLMRWFPSKTGQGIRTLIRKEKANGTAISKMDGQT